MADVAIVKFNDGQDNKHGYEVGDPFPREGFEVSEERRQELRGKNNKAKKPVIKEFSVKEAVKAAEDPVDPVDPEFPKHTGGGYYELSNGEKVQGKENAVQAELAL
ncbi:hypothetical protein DHX103_14440 [Planococcus sp. X10-3]|uniref:hypothetical protein n=1 Tax=Planococcus sp. X10-3 TaxID=3061240 RepID=UPI003BB037D7